MLFFTARGTDIVEVPLLVVESIVKKILWIILLEVLIVVSSNNQNKFANLLLHIRQKTVGKYLSKYSWSGIKNRNLIMPEFVMMREHCIVRKDVWVDIMNWWCVAGFTVL